MFGIGFIELAIIAFIIVLLFGGKKLPELVRGLGEAIREFKRSAKEDEGGKKKG